MCFNFRVCIPTGLSIHHLRVFSHRVATFIKTRMYNQGLLPLDNISYSLPPPIVTPPPQGYQHGLPDQHQPQYQLQTGQYQMQSGQYYAPIQYVTPPVEGQGLTSSQNQVTSVSQPTPTTPIAHTTPTSVTDTNVKYVYNLSNRS